LTRREKGKKLCLIVERKEDTAYREGKEGNLMFNKVQSSFMFGEREKKEKRAF